MPRLKDILRNEIAYFAKRKRLDKHDLENDVLVRIAESDDVPLSVLQWLRDEVRKTAEASARRESRRKSRVRSNSDFEKAPVRLQSAAHEERVLVDDIVQVASIDGFDVEAVQVMRGEHSEFESFSDFVANQNVCSKSEAYRRRVKLKQRIDSLLSVEG